MILSASQVSLVGRTRYLARWLCCEKVCRRTCLLWLAKWRKIHNIYIHTHPMLFIIHQYIYSHSTTKFLFKKYISSHLITTTYILFTNIFTYIYGTYLFIHIQRFIFVHIQDRNISSAPCKIHSAFCVHSLYASLGPCVR